MNGPAFVLLALALAAAVFDWVAVHQEQKALEYLCKPLTLVLLIGCALALTPTTRRCGRGSWPPSCSASPATCS